MSAPVWSLSVNLETKTATFQSGLASAAKSARSAFKEIQSGAGEMSEGASRGFGDIRHSLGLLDNSIRGAHGAAMADAIRLTAQYVDITSALPFAAMAGGFLLVGGGIVALVQKFKEMREEAERAKDANLEFGTGINKVLNALDEKLLETGIRSDELNKDHLAALHKQLELIDKQSMDELAHAFDEVAKEADKVFTELQSHMWQFGIGSAGAQHALEQFRRQYDSLLAQGRGKDAADLLKGTRESAEHVLALQQQLGKKYKPDEFAFGDYDAKDAALVNELKKAGVGLTEKEVRSQQILVQLLDDQADKIQNKANALKAMEGSNATHETSDKFAQQADEVRRQRLESLRKGEAQEEKERQEAYTRALANLEQSEKAKIIVTDKASQERLNAIDAALKEEEMYGLQETAFYRDLQNQRLETIKQMADEEEKQKAEAGKEAASNAEKMAELSLAAEREHQQLLDSMHRMTDQQRITEAMQAASQEYVIKLTVFAREIDALDKHDKDYENKLKAIQDKQKQLVQKHENDITAIREHAETDRNMRLLAAEQRMEEAFARGLTNVIMRQQSFASMMAGISGQITSAMLQNALTDIMTLDMDREKSAAKAARLAFAWGWEHGGPAAPVLAPTLGAMAFAAEMAFASGGIVPGIGTGDVVPAMLTPGEAVLPRNMTELLMNSARSGNTGGGHHYHVTTHVHMNASALDSDGMEQVLHKHADKLQKHFERSLRRLNR